MKTCDCFCVSVEREAARTDELVEVADKMKEAHF